MKWFLILALALSGCVVPDEGGDTPSPRPGMSVQEVAELSVRAEVLGRASALEAEAARLEQDPERIKGETPKQIKADTDKVREQSALAVQEKIGEPTPEELRQVAEGLRRAIQ